MTGEIDDVVTTIFVLIAAFLAILLAAGLGMKLGTFFRDRKYMNMEIRRTTGEEQQYWKRKRRRLWLSLLPFYREKG